MDFVIFKWLTIALVCLVCYWANVFLKWLDSEEFAQLVLRLFPKWEFRLWTTHNWCDAQDATRKWLKANPHANESDPKVQELLRIEAGAYMLWLQTHPYIDGKKQLEKYMEQIESWRY